MNLYASVKELTSVCLTVVITEAFVLSTCASTRICLLCKEMNFKMIKQPDNHSGLIRHSFNVHNVLEGLEYLGGIFVLNPVPRCGWCRG